MSKLFKLIFLALLSAFLVGCSGGGGGSSSSNGGNNGGDGDGTNPSGGGESSSLCSDVNFAAIDTAFPALNTGSYSLSKTAVHHPLVSVDDYINNKITPVELQLYAIQNSDRSYRDSTYTTFVDITKESDGKYSSTIAYRDDMMYDRLKPTDAPLRLVEKVKYLDASITQEALANYRTTLENAGFKYELVNGTSDEYAYIKKSGNCVYEWSDDISASGARMLFSWIILDKYLWEL
jgi:hypothetical protein